MSTALAQVIESIVKQPTPEAVAKLQPLLLAIDTPEARAAHIIAGDFYVYLSAIRNMMSARQFPVLATTLALTSQGIGVAEDIFGEGKTNFHKVMVDGLRMALEVLSTYQFVREWVPSFASVHDVASWNLYQRYWELSSDLQPDMPVTKRAELLDTLFSLVRDPATESEVRLAVLVRLFQWGLMTRLVPLLEPVQS